MRSSFLQILLEVYAEVASSPLGILRLSGWKSS